MTPDRVGKYRILSKIGEGAMGEVFKAHDESLNRYVAIKTMSAANGGDSELRSRFAREAQSAGVLNHPNIITVYDFGEADGHIYIAMELLEGESLRSRIDRSALGGLEDKLQIMDQMCDGLAYAHSMGVIHRDIKPGNIHMGPRGQVKIMDFGLARLSSSEMTRRGMIMGTPNYMSPEQVRGERVETYSDVYSMGAVFYELLSGRRAFDGDSVHTILYKVVYTEPEPLAHLCPDVPTPLRNLVERALAKDPAQRYRNGTELWEGLVVTRKILSGEVTLVGGATTRAADAERLPPAPALSDTRDAPTLVPPTHTSPRPTPPVPVSLSTPVRPPSPPLRHQRRASNAWLIWSGGALAFLLLMAIIGLARSGVSKNEARATTPSPATSREPVAPERTAAPETSQTPSLTASPSPLASSAPAPRPRATADTPPQPLQTRTPEPRPRRSDSPTQRRPLAPQPSATYAPRAIAREERATSSPTFATPYPTATPPLAQPSPSPSPVARSPLPSPTPTAVASLTRPSATTTPAPSSLVPPTKAGDEDAIQKVLMEFKRAVETKDISLYKRVRPVSPSEEKRVRKAFDGVGAQLMNLSVESVDISGNEATARVIVSGLANGEKVKPQGWTVRFARSDNGWTIVSTQ